MSATNPTMRGWPTEDETADLGSVLGALDDDACREILEAASEETLTATELSEQCDIPTSTAYRKVEKLTEAGLVEEKVRINTSGKHATEYRTAFDDVVVTVADGGVELELTRPDTESNIGSAAPIAGD